MLQEAVVEIEKLRPTQIAVGMLAMKHKRAKLRELERRPWELVQFILQHPIRVVIGPGKNAYIIDHHHLGLALLKEKFDSAPMHIEDDFSSLSESAFWAKLTKLKFCYPYDGHGKKRPISAIPKRLDDMEDDPYRALAGFVREHGGFTKVMTPFAEFLWAAYYRPRVKEKLIGKHLDKALKIALPLAHSDEAKDLPGWISAAAAESAKAPAAKKSAKSKK